jgi:hypothetical protein
MATTTNYGWTTPDNTALVKDGALAIRTLGSSIDTTTKALNPSTTLGDIEYRSATANTNTRLAVGTTGQILTVSGGVPAWSTPAAAGGDFVKITSNTFSAATTFTVNDCFSATYDYYKILMTTAGSASLSVNMRLRVSGTDASGANYDNERLYAQGASVGSYETLNATSFQPIFCNTGGRSATEILVSNPFKAENTSIYSPGTFNGHQIDIDSGIHKLNTSYTGFTMFPNTGNITGTYIIYGLKA